LYKEDTNKSIYSFQGMINALSSYAQDTDYGWASASTTTRI